MVTEWRVTMLWRGRAQQSMEACDSSGSPPGDTHRGVSSEDKSTESTGVQSANDARPWTPRPPKFTCPHLEVPLLLSPLPVVFSAWGLSAAENLLGATLRGT